MERITYNDNRGHNNVVSYNKRQYRSAVVDNHATMLLTTSFAQSFKYRDALLKDLSEKAINEWVTPLTAKQEWGRPGSRAFNDKMGWALVIEKSVKGSKNYDAYKTIIVEVFGDERTATSVEAWLEVSSTITREDIDSFLDNSEAMMVIEKAKKRLEGHTGKLIFEYHASLEYFRFPYTSAILDSQSRWLGALYRSSDNDMEKNLRMRNADFLWATWRDASPTEHTPLFTSNIRVSWNFKGVH